MKLDDLRELLPLYALDALPAEEREQLEEALEAHPELWAELKALRETAADLGAAVPAQPRPELKARLLSRIQAETMGSVKRLPKPRPLWPRLGQFAAAAAVLLLAWGGNWAWGWVRAFGDPNTKVVTLVDESKKQIGRYVLRPDGQMVVWADLPPPPPGKTYQLWGVNTADGHLPMPTYKGGLMLTRMPAGHNILHITLENAGGSQTPTELRALPIDESNI
jgi:anti-sigma-K factor RskA